MNDCAGLHTPKCFREQTVSHVPQPVHFSGFTKSNFCAISVTLIYLQEYYLCSKYGFCISSASMHAEEEEKAEESLTKEEEEKVKARLRALGYID